MVTYLDAAGIKPENKDRSLFGSTVRKTKQLTGNGLTSKAICELVKWRERRRVAEADVAAFISPVFRS